MTKTSNAFSFFLRVGRGDWIRRQWNIFVTSIFTRTRRCERDLNLLVVMKPQIIIIRTYQRPSSCVWLSLWVVSDALCFTYGKNSGHTFRRKAEIWRPELDESFMRSYDGEWVDKTDHYFDSMRKRSSLHWICFSWFCVHTRLRKSSDRKWA